MRIAERRGIENRRYSAVEEDTNLVCSEIQDPVPIIPGPCVLPITNTSEVIKQEARYLSLQSQYRLCNEALTTFTI